MNNNLQASGKVIIGISGGVDSSVAALLLKNQGYDVEALFMKNWDERSADGNCLWEADVEDAMNVCGILEIPINTVDLSEQYWLDVFSEFLIEYGSGRTPNPDILCNQEVKFKAFLQHALKLGADKIATGHYARIGTRDKQSILLKGCDANKDQSYFLCGLSQHQLNRCLFPIGELQKPDVRKIASDAGFAIHDKKDSTGICFIGERPFRDFLSQYIPVNKGAIHDTQETIIGEHDGIHFYTLGQRQGLGIGGIKGVNEQPWYVVAKDIETNTLIVAQGHDHPLLYSQGLFMTDPHWVADQPPNIPFTCKAKIRYRQRDQVCTIESLAADKGSIRFEQAQRAVTPGQYIVFYDGDICLGGGVIASTWN